MEWGDVLGEAPDRDRSQRPSPHPQFLQTSLQEVGSELTQMRPKLEKVWDVPKAQSSELKAQQLVLEGPQNQGLNSPPPLCRCQACMPREGPTVSPAHSWSHCGHWLSLPRLPSQVPPKPSLPPS